MIFKNYLPLTPLITVIYGSCIVTELQFLRMGPLFLLMISMWLKMTEEETNGLLTLGI